jgi:multidrug efflux pump subunit AcrB
LDTPWIFTSKLKHQNMRSTIIQVRREQVPFIILMQFFFLLFILVSCGEVSTAFPPPNADAWCTYDVTFNRGTSQDDIEKEKAAFEKEIKEGAKSTVDSINCESSVTWREVSAHQWQAEVTVNCYRVSDSSVVRPPSTNKPPAGRVANGEVVQSGCGDDKIKK